MEGVLLLNSSKDKKEKVKYSRISRYALYLDELAGDLNGSADEMNTHR